MEMTHTYDVQNVKDAKEAKKAEHILASFPGVLSASVDAGTHTAIIKMERHLSQDVFNATLKDAGTQCELSDERMLTNVTNTAPTGLQAYIPLIVAFGLILTFTFIRGGQGIAMMMNFMGAFFLIFGGMKLLKWKDFADAYATYDVLAMRSRIYSFTYPLIEIFLGLSYVGLNPLTQNDIGALTLCAFTVLLMSVSSIGVARALLKKQKIQCACLGTIFKIPMSSVTLMEDLLMAGMALYMTVLISAFLMSP